MYNNCSGVEERLVSERYAKGKWFETCRVQEEKKKKKKKKTVRSLGGIEEKKREKNRAGERTEDSAKKGVQNALSNPLLFIQ